MSEYDEIYDDEDEEISAEDVIAMLRGDHGREAQQAAFALTGYEPEDAAEGEVNPEFAQAFTAQALQVERQLGRPLTGQEVHALAVDSAGTEPDVAESYDRVIGRDLNDDDDRKQIAVEYMQEADEAQDAQAAGQVPEGSE